MVEEMYTVMSNWIRLIKFNYMKMAKCLQCEFADKDKTDALQSSKQDNRIFLLSCVCDNQKKEPATFGVTGSLLEAAGSSSVELHIAVMLLHVATYCTHPAYILYRSYIVPGHRLLICVGKRNG